MRSAIRNSTERRGMHIFLGATAVILLLLGLYTFRMIVVTGIVGVLGGVLLEPVIRILQTRLRLPHGMSVAVTVLLLLGAFSGIAYAGYSLLAGQAQHLAEQGPAILQKLQQQIEATIGRFSWLGIDGSQFDPGKIIQQAAGTVLKAITLGVEGLSYAAVVFMIAVFVAANFRSYGRGCLTLFPLAWRDRVVKLTHGSVRVLRRWFVGQITVVTISGVLTGIALAIIGIEYWLIVAALTVVLDFIPFFGAIITGTVAAALTLGTDPSKLVWVIGVYVLIQQLESDVVMPLVMKGRVKIPEAHLLLFLLVMGSAFGVIGIFLSPPVFAVLHYLYAHGYVPWLEAKPIAATPA